LLIYSLHYSVSSKGVALGAFGFNGWWRNIGGHCWHFWGFYSRICNKIIETSIIL